MRYQTYSTVDNLGARCQADEGWLNEESDDVGAATDSADKLTAMGCCGYAIDTVTGDKYYPSAGWLAQKSATA